MKTIINKDALPISRNAPVILKRWNGSHWGKPIYFPKGDESIFIGKAGDVYTVTCHGAGWLNGKLVTCAADAARILSGAFTTDLVNTIGQNLRGSLCIYLQSCHSYQILPDPLGAAILFEYRSPKTWAYSSDLGTLVEAVKMCEEEPKKSFDYLVEVIATGNGGFFPASYEAVNSFSPFSYVSFDDSNTLVGTYNLAKTFFSRPVSMDDLFEEARTDLIENVSAVANSDYGNRISHLTGGFDSRLVLAALLYSGNQDKFRFMCSGNTQMTDRKIAGNLCGHIGIPLTNSDGTIAAPYSPGNAMFDTHGLLRMNIPRSALPDHVLMSGGYGECLRSFYGARGNNLDTLEETLQTIYGKAFAIEEPRMLTNQFYSSYIERFKYFVSDAKASGIPSDAILDYMYASKRNRYFVGLVSEHHSNITPRVDPIYSVNAVRLGLFTPQTERAGNVLGLRMMTSLWPELASLPFDSDRITPIYESLYGKITRKSFNGRSAQHIHDHRITAHPSKPATKEQIARAKEIKGSLSQIVHLHDVQIELKNLLNKHRATISKSINWTVANRFLNPNLFNRVHIRTVFDMYDSLRWFNIP